VSVAGNLWDLYVHSWLGICGGAASVKPESEHKGRLKISCTLLLHVNLFKRSFDTRLTEKGEEGAKQVARGAACHQAQMARINELCRKLLRGSMTRASWARKRVCTCVNSPARALHIHVHTWGSSQPTNTRPKYFYTTRQKLLLSAFPPRQSCSLSHPLQGVCCVRACASLYCLTSYKVCAVRVHVRLCIVSPLTRCARWTFKYAD